MPAQVVSQLLQELYQQLKEEPPGGLAQRWQHLKLGFSSILVVDGSTLEELGKKSGELQGVEVPGVQVHTFGVN